MVGNSRRSPLVVLGFLIFFVVAVYKTANYVIAGDMTGLAIVALVFVGCEFVIGMLYNWRKGLSFFLAYRRKQVASFRPPFLVPLLLFVWFGVMQVFNPASTNLMYGVLGLKLFFYYIPLLFVGYALLNSEAELRQFFFVNMILAVIIVSLGIAQAIIGHTFLNL